MYPAFDFFHKQDLRNRSINQFGGANVYTYAYLMEAPTQIDEKSPLYPILQNLDEYIATHAPDSKSRTGAYYEYRIKDSQLRIFIKSESDGQIHLVKLGEYQLFSSIRVYNLKKNGIRMEVSNSTLEKSLQVPSRLDVAFSKTKEEEEKKLQEHIKKLEQENLQLKAKLLEQENLQLRTNIEVKKDII